MGVPKFFRYISERYPCLSELAREQSIADFDNLYLDMNGIIHTCSHPDDSNFHFTITEENMFKDIFNYIDKLFFLIKPQKLFFMAVDGVAPRAKMNQQRSRRFRSAKDAEILEAKAKSRGEVRETERFDSNCITPGTEFMVRLQEALRYFIKSKISSDPLWQKCRVILSGHDAPGEGEHKIMDYIRYLKSQKDYDPNTRHCLYGLDADLIILGQCTHEPHFVVLREEVKFGRKTKQASVEETRFFLLHLGLLREYLELEFDELKKNYDNFNISNLIDDWVLMGFLVGNDFIPHLPCMHISSNALPLLYKTYIKVYPTLGGNINVNGKLNLERLEKYFAELSNVEYEIFQENHADLKYFEAKQTKNGIDEAFDFDINEITLENQDADLADLIASSRQFLEDDDEDLSDEEQHLADEFETYKRNYYMNKLNQNDMNCESKREQAICYITALQWILDYYYRGVQSWDWYYPHHYAPFISDLKNFKDYKIKFNLGEPFLPFEQLLAVLPAASKDLLPAAYRELMTSTSSELLEFYPKDFETDLNGKKHEWEAVVLIPFIDEKRLLDAMKACEKNLTPAEVKRNRHGPMHQYDYHPESQGSAPGIFSLRPLYSVFCTEQQIWSREIAVPSDKTVCVELPNAARTVFFPGFPTMKHLKYDFELKFARVRVFEQSSRSENLILKPHMRKGLDDIYTVAEKYLNQVVYTGWPHLIKSKVVGISNREKYIDAEGIKDMEPRLFQIHMKTAQEHLSTRMGIELDDFSVLVHVRVHIGTTCVCGNQGKIIVNDAWGYSVTAYPAQTVVAEIAVQKSGVTQPKKVENFFPTDSTVFFLGSPYFGSEGTVLNPMLVYECGRLKVNITVLPEPDFTAARLLQHKLERDYVHSFQVAATVSIQMRCLGRVTGTVLVVAGARRKELPENVSKVNIGLQLKFPKQQEERAGYCRRINNQWYYSSKAMSLIQEYYLKYPMVFDFLSRSSDRNEFCFEEDLFPKEVGERKLDEIITWLKSQDHVKADRRLCGSQTMEKEAVESVLDAIEQLKTLPVKTVKLQVKPHLLLKPDVTLANIYKPKRPVKLFDRVVVVKTTYMVPLGAKGTVIGVYPITDPNPVRMECVKSVDIFYEILFDKHLPSGNDVYGIAEERVYRVSESALLLISAQDNKQNEMQDTKPNQLPNEDRTVQSNHNGFAQAQKQQQQQLLTPQQSSELSEPSGSNEPSSSNNAKISILQQRAEPPKALLPAQSTYKSAGGGGAIDADDFWMPAAETKVKHTVAKELALANAEQNNVKIQSKVIDSTTKGEYATPNEAAKSENPQEQLMQKLLLGNRTAAPKTASVSDASDCQAGTQALKSILGVGLNPATVQPQTSQKDKRDGSQPLKKQLPQPPAGWRSDAQQAQQLPLNRRPHYQAPNRPLQPIFPLQQQQQPPQLAPQPNTLLHYGGATNRLPGQPMPPPPPTHYNNMGGYYPPKMLFPAAYPMQQHTPHPPLPFQMIHPINEKSQPNATLENMGHPPSAFIPLQVLRGNAHQQAQAHVPASPQQPTPHQERQRTVSAVKGAPINTKKANVQALQQTLTKLQIKSEASNTQNLPQNVQQLPEQASTKATNETKNDGCSAQPEQPRRKRSPRVPKIGARFDNAQ
ncbi:PREDICTED: 5'-3' exoribonuclease 1 [Bactrocera latifrons]|uniref:5'-3' exoribonuclease 1 n=1 Tax=Bactrocera latifrons TaxID=174628 RepID=A0A0K8WBL0_BACLA|nr:PREDICTED: 5'-3' exoribonuclease 1 [Bactrocera latifrons]XP_018800270.1 PREDICTED: 5'-3' exoribonuclease 1 [Bactrocera latifrons]XP_018800271.1 PREDICTED: 5'-3' exoribonuclease 1 [Bactrocera latifrons]